MNKAGFILAVFSHRLIKLLKIKSKFVPYKIVVSFLKGGLIKLITALRTAQFDKGNIFHRFS